MANMSTEHKRRRFRIGGTWGFHIRWFTNHERVWGHWTPLPRVGDVVVSPMQSGREAVYRITKVEPQGEPTDMFFADVEPIDYTDQPAAEVLLDDSVAAGPWR